MKYANLLNRRAFHYIFSESADEISLLNFFNCFLKTTLDLTLTRINWTNTLHTDPFFRFRGCLTNEVIVAAESTTGDRVFIQLDTVFLHWGLTQIDLELTDKVDFYRSQREKIEEPVTFIHLAFANFDFNKSGETVITHSNLYSWKKDLTAHFVWYNLPNSTLEKTKLNETEQWIFFLTKANQFTTVPTVITNQSVRAAFKKLELDSWEQNTLKWYREQEGDIEQRQQRVYDHYQNKGAKLHPDYQSVSAPYAMLHGWKVLLRQLGVYPKRAVKSSDINIQQGNYKVVFTLFRDWTKQVESETGYSIEIKNEQALVKDFNNALRIAIIYIYTDDSFLENKFDKEWEMRLLATKINAELNLHWHFEYITKNTGLFKSMQALRATLAYLAANEIAEIKIDNVYQDFLKESSNLNEISPEIDVQKASQLVNISDKLFSTAPGQIRIVLKNLMGEMIPKLQSMTKNLPFYLEESEELHDYTALERVIRDNEALFYQ